MNKDILVITSIQKPFKKKKGNVVYFYDCALDGNLLGHLSNSFASATIII